MKTLYLFLSMLLVLVNAARAEYMPPFDLGYCVGEAKVIVQGTLDPYGDITVTQVFRSQDTIGATLKLYNGDYEYKSMRKIMGGSGPVEVMVFLDEDSTLGWRTVQSSPAVVGFQNEDVFLVEGDDFWNYLQKSQRFAKTSFLSALQDATKRKEERERLAALPRSVERTMQLIGLAVQNHQDEPKGRKSLVHRPCGYELGHIAQALKTPSAQEQTVLLDALRTAKTAGEQVVLLDLAQEVPLTSESMDTVAGFLPRTNPPVVREAAMNALHDINAYKVVDYLMPYLVPEEPQLASVLQNFGSSSYPPQDQLLNIHAVDALKRLAEAMPGPDEVPIGNGHVSGAISGELCYYLHPRLMPILYARAIHGEEASSAQVFSDFRSTIGLNYPREDEASWAGWWKRAQPLLEGDLNLQTVEGRRSWMDRHAKADPATQGGADADLVLRSPC